MYPIYSTYKRGCEKSCGALGGGALIACFLVHGIGTACDRYQAPGGGERATIPIRGGESFFPLRTRGVVKNLK